MMNRKIFATVLVAALVVLSGCSGFMPGDGNDVQTTNAPGTDTPGEDVEYPAGVDADGVTNASALISAHNSALDGESIQTTVTVTSTGNEQTTQFNYQNKSGDDFAFYATQELLERSSSQYYDSTTQENLYLRTQSGNETNYQRSSAPTQEDAANRVSQSSFLETFVSLFEYEVSSTETGETKLSSTSVTDMQNLTNALGFENISSASMDVTVSETGVITNTELSVESDGSSNKYSVSIDAGDVTVDEPEWLTEAQQQAPSMNVSVSEDNSYFVLNYTSGHDITEGAVVYISSANRTQQATVESALESGNTYYISVAGETPEIVSEPPAEGSIEPGTYTLAGLSTGNQILFEEDVQVGEASGE